MKQKWLTLIALVGMAANAFGFLYEAAVLSPYWVENTATVIDRLRPFFVRFTSPFPYFTQTNFFGPLTLVAIVPVLILWLRDRSRYWRPALVALIFFIVNGVTIATVTSLFGPNPTETIAWTWNALNLLRVLLTGIATVMLFQIFRDLDRGEPEPIAARQKPAPDGR